jgi:pimeloyl-ACP methyl ester carboxylesterase
LHGIGSNALSFAPLMRELGASRWLLAWDAPGYGASEPLEADWPAVDHYVAALEDLLARLGIDGIDLLGHSLGALMAGRFALRHPDRVGALVLASPALGYGTAPGAPLAPPAATRLDALVAEGGERFAASRGPRLVFDRTDAGLVGAVVKAMSEVRLPGYAQASRMLSSADLVEDGRRLAVRTLVLVGDHDEITPPANCRRLYEAMCGAAPSLGHRFALVPRAGHAVVQEQPRAVAGLLREFISTETAGR